MRRDERQSRIGAIAAVDRVLADSKDALDDMTLQIDASALPEELYGRVVTVMDAVAAARACATAEEWRLRTEGER